MMQGSLFDFSAGALTANATLASLGVFGESHWYWSDDEAAFLSGQAAGGVTSRSYNKVCTKDYGKKRYEDHFAVNYDYNCIVGEALIPKLSVGVGEVNPLDSFRKLSDYVDPEFDLTPIVAETVSSPELDGNKAVYRAIVITSVSVCVIAAATVIIVCIVRSRRKKA